MCFSTLWLVQTLIWLVVVCAVVAILRILVPYVISWMGADGTVVMRIINIVIAAIVIIAVIWFIYDLVVCLGYPGSARRLP